ncbi:MAG TPA: dipeptidase [Vicinamibacterales bacterium]
MTSRFRLTISAACAAVTLLVPVVSAQRSPGDELLERARKLHREVPLIDGHNDIPWAMREGAWYDFDKIDLRLPQPSLHTDIPRLRAGGVGGQFWSVYVPSSLQGERAVTATLEQIDAVYAMLARYPDTFELARTADDVERIFKAGKIASLIGMEGGHSIDSSLGALRMFRRLGVAYMTLTHSDNIPWADAATDDPVLGGLSPFGEEVVREMNRLGMLVDLSHVSPDTMADAIRVSEAPVIFSHSSARALCDVPRNVPDEILRQIPKNGGIVMVTFVPGFVAPDAAAHSRLAREKMRALRAQHGEDAQAVQQAMRAWLRDNPGPKATLAQVADHIDHIRKVAGIDHIGLGGDYDGVNSLPEGLEDVSKYPALTAELLARGYSDEDVRKILGRNILRVMRRAEEVAKQLQQTRPPSLKTLETATAAR